MIVASPKVYSVTELNKYVKSYIDSNENLSTVFVSGEISNFKAHYTGHMYMTLKDEKAAVKAVMFAGNASRLRFMPENGMKVLVIGSVSLFERDGSYQLYINDMQPDGTGSLTLAFEQLKKKLSSEGLFDSKYKKPIPHFPKRVGVITSETGAAIRDIINVIGRRCPTCEIIVKSVLVQGEGAASDIAGAIRLFNKKKAADVLIVGRGGGSLEDLWAFNEEAVARAVFESDIPVISAVGHETDFTVCDFVADLRAPTPSAAAELAVPDLSAVKSSLSSARQHLYSVMCSEISRYKERIAATQKNGALKNPILKIADNRKLLAYYGERLSSLSENTVRLYRTKLSLQAGKLDALSPLKVISRGYAAAFKGGVPITDIASVSLGDKVSVRVKNGAFCAEVTKIINKED